MAKLNMKRLQLIALQRHKEALLWDLQQLGVVELSVERDARLGDISAKEEILSLEKNLITVGTALEVLHEYAPPAGSMMDLFHGRKGVSKQELAAFEVKADETMQAANEIARLRQEITEHKAEVVRVRTQLDGLELWRGLDVSFQPVNTAHTATLIGTLPQNHTSDSLAVALAERCPEDPVVCEIVNATKQQTALWVMCHKTSRERIFTALREMGFTLPADVNGQMPRDRIAALETKLEQERSSSKNKREQIVALAEKREQLELLYDRLTMEKERLEASERLQTTAETLVLTGYVPEPCLEQLQALADRYEAVLQLAEPDEDADVPVALQNNAFAEPVETITEMYALPGKKDIDPSAVMAFFYYLLFGMMLSDAGYGLLMTVGTWFVLKKTNVEGGLRKSLKMFFYCGISTLFWGALFGSWFGDIVPIIYTQFLNRPAPNLALWFEPIKDPIKLLLFSFVIGICHLFLGLITAGRMQWQAGKKLDAVLDTVPIMLLVLGAAPLAAGVLVSMPTVVTEIAKYVAIVGVLLVILTSARDSKSILGKLLGGLYGLYNIASGYLSDILSYSRLLALGLATGSIAGVVNMMGAMPQNLVLKGVLLTVVFIVGHALNMAINVLGAYVHTNRLQFVELFSKFYEGGGRAFRPLQMNTKYIKLKEEHENE